MDPYNVGIIGATGLVGQRLAERLARHPWLRLTAVAASERSAGRRYGEAVAWALPGDPPAAAATLTIRRAVPDSFVDCDLVISALDARTARELEPALAAAGIPVVSNASAFRMDPRVPLVVPEVNASHLEILRARPSGGFIVTNPNCSTTGLVLALAPLERAFGVERVVVATLQAVSGAGLSGPRALELIDNAIPFIEGEEEKMEVEAAKILGATTAGEFVPAALTVAAHCHRVPTLEGHLESVSVALASPASPEEAARAIREFRGEVADDGLPSAPARPVIVRDEPDRPQPRLDRDAGGGMSAVVGRLRPCPVLGLRFVVLSHNTVRGAAGGALLNAEALAARGLIRRRRPA